MTVYSCSIVKLNNGCPFKGVLAYTRCVNDTHYYYSNALIFLDFGYN